MTNGIPATVRGAEGASVLNGVACSSTTRCEAVGLSPWGMPGVAVRITDGIPGPGHIVGGTLPLHGLACANATTCESVGTDSSGTVGVAVPINNSLPGTVPGSPEDVAVVWRGLYQRRHL